MDATIPPPLSDVVNVGVTEHWPPVRVTLPEPVYAPGIWLEIDTAPALATTKVNPEPPDMPVSV